MKPFVMGLYPMATDETVRSVVIDFDEASWRRDALFVVRKARELELPVALEKSRSGKGAHLWFFLPLWSTGQYVAPQDPLPPLADVRVVRANRVYVEQKNLTPSVRCKLIGLTSFNNPEFYKRQRMKYSVYGEPRVISRALSGDEFLQVPRGCLEGVIETLKAERLNPVVEDKRYAGVPIDVSFKGELRVDQKAAVADLKKSDMGILAAGMVTASAGSGLDVPSESETRVYKKWSGGVRRATTFCRMSAGGDELVWRAVSDASRQIGGDNLGVAVEERNGQRPGDASEPPMGWQAGGR